MPQNDRDKLNRIEELKSKLFSKNYRTKIGHIDRFTRFKSGSDVPDAWDNGVKSAADGPDSSQDKFFMKTSIFKNFFIFASVFLVLTLLYASYIFFKGGITVSNENIDISILGNNFTAGGEDLQLTVSITNKNSSDLDLVDLVMEYPKSSSTTPGGSSGLPGGVERFRESLGTIPSGAVRNENLKVVLFGEQGSVRPIKFSLEYRVAGSNAIFVKEKSYDVTINSTPLNLSVDAPAEASSNQDITLRVKATLNATHPAAKLLLKLDYPAGFQFESSSPTPSLGNNIWNLGDLPPGAERNISITGKMIDAADGEEKTFNISSGSQGGDKSVIDVVFNSISHTVLIKRPFIEARLLINGVSGNQYAANTKSPIQGEIRWTNNLDTKVNDLSIKAKISGNAVNRGTIDADAGFYDSATDTITWDKSSESDFSEVNPGDSGSVNFSVSPVSLFSASGEILANPVINISISISGKQSLEGFETTNLNNSDEATVKIISDVGFAAKALYYSGPFVNRGPVPPKVGSETTYTIEWSLTNTANSISKGVVRSNIPSWMKFVGPISPSGEDLTFNPSTREIVWNIGAIKRGTGITGASRMVSFQVAFTPSLSQVRTTPVIINDSVLTGHDDFANVDVRVSKSSLRTSLDSDPLFPSGGGSVAE